MRVVDFGSPSSVRRPGSVPPLHMNGPGSPAPLRSWDVTRGIVFRKLVSRTSAPYRHKADGRGRGSSDNLGKVVDESRRPHQEQINGVSVDARCRFTPRRGRVAGRSRRVCSVPANGHAGSRMSSGNKRPMRPKTHSLA